ncbi:hypothetical protein AB0J52_12795 [Spirillospora sp. NPDC049652]
MSEFAALMTNVGGSLTKLSSTMDAMTSKVNSILSKVPGWLSYLFEPLKTAWNKFASMCSKVFKEVGDFIAHTGDSDRLRKVSKDLSNNVQASVSAQAGKITDTYMHVDDKWTGDAAEQYKKVLAPNGEQASALRQYASTVQELCGALDKCAGALNMFWITFFVALGTLIGSLVAAIAGFVSIVGAIPALLYSAGVIAIFLGVVATAGVVAYDDMSDAASTMRVQNNGNDHLAEGKWPPTGVPQS